MKGDSHNLSQVSVLQLQGTCSCDGRSNCPDTAQKTFHSNADRLSQVSCWIFITEFVLVLVEVSNLTLFFNNDVIDSVVLGFKLCAVILEAN